jgi:hypothetical protein
VNHPRFYRIAAVCSVLSAFTTLGLIFLPSFFAPGEGFEARMARVHDPAYQLRAWIYLVHPFLVLTAALAIAMVVRMRAPVLAAIGLLGFILWAFTEAGQQTLTLFAFDPWRAAYASADEAARAGIRLKTEVYDGLWNGMYVLILIGFAIGNLCFGSALLRAKGLTRVVAGFLLAAFVLTFALFVGELGWALPEAISFWSYPTIQPLGRVLIGVWLWRTAANSLA